MTTMLELAAKAIAVEWYCETGHNDAGAVAAAESQWKGFESLARAALQAIRGEDEELDRVVSRAAWHSGSGQKARNIRTAMIDAILSESANP